MKIIYISNSIIPSKTANSIHVMKMCQAFSNNGHDVTLLALILQDINKKYLFEYYGVKKNFNLLGLQFQKFKFGKLFNYAYKIYDYLKRTNFDLAYGRFLHGCFIACVVLNKKTFFETHSPYEMLCWYEKKLLGIMIKNKNFQKLVVISESLKNMYIATNIISHEKIIVAHDGADEQSDFEGILDKSDKLRVGYFGHLYKGRGIDLIIKLSNLLPDVEFHIVGGDDNHINFWKSQTQNHNLIFHGFVEPKVVYKYRNSCDALLAPYQEEVTVSGDKGNTSAYMSPLKVFEYMSSKKPIICSNLPVLKEILNETNSILVELNDLNGWINSINKIKSDTSFMKLISKNSYQTFIAEFTWDKRVKRIMKKYI